MLIRKRSTAARGGGGLWNHLANYYRLEEATGLAGVDSFGGRSLAVFGTGATRVAGKNNFGQQFAINNGLNWGAADQIPVSGGFTLCAWTSFSASTAGPCITLGNSIYGNVAAVIRTGLKYGIYAGAGPTMSVTDRTVGVVHHLAYRYTPPVHDLFVDGVLDVTRSQVKTGNFVIQAGGAASQTGTIMLDEIAFFNAPISDGQILGQFNGGAGVFY